jgi:hypothetical protein
MIETVRNWANYIKLVSHSPHVLRWVGGAGWGSADAALGCLGGGENNDNGKIQESFPFDKLRVRMTIVFGRSGDSVW